MEYKTLEVEKKGPIIKLTLKRPECLNAINREMRDDLRSFLSDRFQDHDTRVIVVTGAGRGFCAGLDMKDSSLVGLGENRFTPELAYRSQGLFSEFILFMRRIPQVIVGAINGAATGAGLSIAMACDVRLAAPEAKFGAAYINIGVGGADMGCSWFLPRLIGMGNAARYMMTGDLFGAEEAHRMGLVQSLADKDKLVEEAMALAAKMASKSPLGLRLTKEALDINAGNVTLEEAVRLEDRNQAMCISQLAIQMSGGKG